MESVLITGGAGSLGRAFVRLLHADYSVAVIDSNEWALAELKSEYPGVVGILGDFASYPLKKVPDYVLHLAAYKHVNMGEQDVLSFLDNNLYKTEAFYRSLRHEFPRLLYVSTDKAVEPVSAYGATKMLAEKLTWAAGGSVARLGNILNSSGSVIPVWEQCIAEERPIKVTDERMTRYLIEDMDAATQIWNEFMKGEKLIVPKMGEPRRLMDILSEVLLRHGYASPETYGPGVEVIGMRPGEKLEEKLWWDHEAEQVAPKR